MRIVTFRAGFLLHGLVGKRAGLELVAEKTKIVPLPRSLEQVFCRISIAVASGTAADSQRPVEDRKTCHIRVAATCSAIFRWRGRTLPRIQLRSRQAQGKKRNEQKNHRRDYKTAITFGTTGSQSAIPIVSKRSLRQGSV
jgi:hypothetical protein